MPSKKPKQPAERFPLSLTGKQREALIEATRLKRALKERMKEAPSGTRSIPFTAKELTEVGNEAYKSLSFAPKPHQQRLLAVLDKINDLLDEQEIRAVQERRQKLPTTGLIYQFKVTLKGSKPPIWRRFQMPDGTLGQLHDVLQDVMGWTDSHLHQFIIRGEYHGVPPEDDLDFGMDMHDEEDTLISQVASSGGKVKFAYEYDFGDNWQHELVLEKILEPEPGSQYPRCLDGARACPPEDCGGVWGYVEFVEAMADPDHEAHDDLKEWIGGDFDPDRFSVEAINKELRRLTSG